MDRREKLDEFYLFDEGVLQAVERTAEEQAGLPVAEIAANYGVSAIAHRNRPSTEQVRRLEYLDFIPPKDRYAAYDEGQARVLFSPTDTPISEAVARRALRLYGAQPDRRLLVIGGPASPLDNTVRFSDAWSVWRGQLQSVVDPTITLLNKQHVESIEVLGVFTGAELAAATASAVATKKRDLRLQSVTSGVFVLPAAIRRQLPGAVMPRIVPAGDEASPLARVRTMAARARLSNLVMARAVARGGFYDRAMHALAEHDELRTTIVWSTASEESDQLATTQVINKLRGGFRERRVGALALDNADYRQIQADDDLHTAVMLQSLATSSA